MLENPVYLPATRRMSGSDNASSAENQQERLFADGWVVGFVDGEGCFSCPIQRNRTMALGWQVQPRFLVVQGASSAGVLEDLSGHFGCGRIYRNRRRDNHREDLFVYSVHRLEDLRHRIVPFFEANPLRTAKRDNFVKFARIVELMGLRRHLCHEGLVEIAKITETMNFRKPSAALRILRDHTPTPSSISRGEDEMARSLWRHREADGNDQPADRGSPPDRSIK
jgi:hypothetical protein